MDSAWDQLLALTEHLATRPDLPVDTEPEQTLTALCVEAMVQGEVDRELHPPAVARWVLGLVVAHHSIRHTHPEVDADTDLSMLRVVMTRWLHPARLDR